MVKNLDLQTMNILLNYSGFKIIVYISCIIVTLKIASNFTFILFISSAFRFETHCLQFLFLASIILNFYG